jgi:unsaturated rhamnogalacturonyl hydrolase
MWTRMLLSLALAQAGAAQMKVALDGYHNNESKMPDHYQWDGTRNGGFSQLGKLLTDLGAELQTVRERVTAGGLKGVDMFIIVDPDTPAETESPKYIEPDEIEAIAGWVKQGGRLVLLGNDKGNAEFEHLNQLAARFDIQFIEATYPKTAGKGILIATGSHAIFESGLQVYLVEVAPLRVSGKTEVLFESNGTPLMALAHYGSGTVFALGDPWIYNEYIGHKDNRRVATNLFRMLMKN